jgi:parvulin-like peptidyl-prolyl isomerase
MAKSRQPRSNPNLTKKQLSRRQREQRQLRWIWIGVGALSAAIAIILATGLIVQNRQPMAVVNGTTIRVPEYQKRLRFWVNYYNDFLVPGSIDRLDEEQRTSFYQEIADQLIEERIIEQEATKNDVSVSDDEIEIEIEETWFQHYRTPPTPTPSPTLDPEATPAAATTPLPTATPDTPEAYQERYDEFVDQVLKPSRASEAYFRRIVRATLLRTKLQTVLVPTVPTEEDQVRFRYLNATDAQQAAEQRANLEAGVTTQVQARHILVDTEQEATDILQRVQAGEDFAALAAQFSADESNKDQGGDLGWFGRGQMVPEFEQAAFEGEIGLYPTPVQSQFGFHVIEILAREERPHTADEAMTEAGWYNKSDLAEYFGPLFAEILFGSEIGLLADPVPTQFGVAIVELQEHAMRELDEQEQEIRRSDLFQQRLQEIRDQADIQDQWDLDMVPSGL